jgi:hypothetical protein
MKPIVLHLAILAGLVVPGAEALQAAPGRPATVVSEASASAASTVPFQLWVAPLAGRDLEAAWSTGAALLDRFPDAVIVRDATAASALASGGFHVTGPLEVSRGESVFLLRARSAPTPAAELSDATLARLGARALWRSGRDLVVAVRGALGEDPALAPFARKALGTSPLRGPDGRAGRTKATPLSPPAISTNFASVIGQMVAQVDTAAYIQWVKRLAGGTPVQVGGSPVTFTTRSTPTTQCDLAEQYVYERFLAMGFTDVQYDPYSIGGTSARNVVATLPGTDVPESIVIVGGHLDSTSPQASTLAPGANDNASGVAAVLTIANILKNYQFRSTIRFIAFTGEEQGLYGSQHYAQMAALRGDPIAAVVICDMIAWYGAQYRVDIEGESPWDWLMQIMNDACHTYTRLGTNLLYSSWGSDHVPFQDQNYPAFLAIESDYAGYSCYHQICDTWEKQLADFGGDVTRACLATAAHVAGIPAFFISHTPLPSTTDTHGAYEVVAQVTQLAPLVADSLQLRYSLGWSYFRLPLLSTGTPGTYHAFIPGQAAVTGVRYYLTAADVAGRHAASPDSAPAAVHRFYVGPRTTLMNEGFETGGPGWTHGGTLDDWQCDSPRGLAEDPPSAHMGTKVYGTDLTGLGANLGRYENHCDTYLESPALDCSHCAGMKLTFWRWLAVQRAYSGIGDIARVSVNGVPIWVNDSLSNTVDPDWTFQEFDISALADGKPAVRLRFSLVSNGGGVAGGWNVDDVVFTGISTITTTETAERHLPPVVALHPAVPNPCNPSATLRFDLPARSFADLSIFDVQGKRVRTLVHGELEPGTYRPVWDGGDRAGLPAASGVYFSRLATPDGVQTRKLVLLR